MNNKIYALSASEHGEDINKWDDRRRFSKCILLYNIGKTLKGITSEKHVCENDMSHQRYIFS